METRNEKEGAELAYMKLNGSYDKSYWHQNHLPLWLHDAVHGTTVQNDD